MTTTENTDLAEDQQQDTESVEDPQEAEQEVSEDQQQAEETDQDSEVQEDGSKAHREAAKYRRQLREAEAERDQLAEHVQALQTYIAESAIKDLLRNPAALWMTGAKVSDFYDDEGGLKVEQLREAAQEARREHGLAIGGTPPEAFSLNRRPDPGPSSSFTDAFRPSDYQ